MHELTVSQVQALVTAVKMVAGKDALIVCNAGGLFASAPRLATQLELLFDSEIDLVFAGEQAIARNAGRNELQAGKRPVIRPANLSDRAPGVGTMLVEVNDEKIWMVCLAEQSFKTPVAPAHESLDEFFRNKNDPFPVFINMNGKDSDYKRALAWKYGKEQGSVTITGTGIGFASSEAKPLPGGGVFVADAGVTASEDAIAGMAPDIWWRRNIERLPVAILPGTGSISTDFSVFVYEKGKVVKVLAEKVSV